MLNLTVVLKNERTSITASNNGCAGGCTQPFAGEFVSLSKVIKRPLLARYVRGKCTTEASRAVLSIHENVKKKLPDILDIF